jgi:hypothetical protein
MKVSDFNGKQHNWPPSGHVVSFDDTRPRSALHIRVREILRRLYPTSPILEEVPLPGTGLFADFYLPIRRAVIECNGEQHYRFVPHFHQDRRTFMESKNRDQRKIDWCHLNNIHVAILPYDKTDEELIKLIEEANS